VDVYILEKLKMHVNRLKIEDWKAMVGTLISPKNGAVDIAVVGKYISLRDSYKSIYEALTHGGAANDVKVNIRMVESEDIEKQGPESLLAGVHGILVPGGFGDRGIEGKIATVRHAREKRVPFLGICLGMQCSVIEFARHVCGMAGANSTEFRKDCEFPVIDLMAEQKQVKGMGGNMRLGGYACQVADGTRARTAYAAGEVVERHRHRYEFNNRYRECMEQKGMIFSGISAQGNLVEIVELRDHPWFVACQFHPEFQSTPLKAHPLFRDFVATAVGQRGA
jgi:CTP synthase